MNRPILRPLALAALAALPIIAFAAGPLPSSNPIRTVVASSSCSQAISQSRLLCLSGSNCQREISPILRSCNSTDQGACAAARDELRAACASPLPWYGSLECESAVRQVRHYCGR